MSTGEPPSEPGPRVPIVAPTQNIDVRLNKLTDTINSWQQILEKLLNQTIALGSPLAAGKITVTGTDGHEAAALSGQTGAIQRLATLAVDGGNFSVVDDNGVVLFSVAQGLVTAGGVDIHGHGTNSVTGVVQVDSGDGFISASLDGQHGLTLGAPPSGGIEGTEGTDGRIRLVDKTGATQISIESGVPQITIGSGGPAVALNHDRITLWNAGHITVELDGPNGDITLANAADCAETFELEPGSPAQPGDVLVITDHARLRVSTSPYDRRVAGIFSGAGDYKPGLLLNGGHQASAGAPVALAGRAYCRVDASDGPIDVGDLLTTSPRPGHAMRATDPARAHGAILGKALAPVDTGACLIPVLVALQ